MSSACLFIPPQENATKIGRRWIDCVLQWFWLKCTVYFHKAYVFRQIKPMNARSDITETAFRNIATPFPLRDPAVLVAFLRWDLPKNVFPPRISRFVGSSLIHRDFSASRAPAAAELSGGANKSHVCCKNSVFCKCVQADIHQHRQT